MMTKPSTYTTITFIRVQEIEGSDCTGCVADYEGVGALCDYLRATNGACAESNMIYIIDHPEHIANYTRKRITQ
jgi:hypothetical protein